MEDWTRVMTRLGHYALRTGQIGAVIALICSTGGLARASGETIAVLLDKATILKMPPHAETIVVGNPIIADVTTFKSNGLVVVTGKGFGETNLIFLDGSGAAIEEANIRVEGAASLLTVQRGMERESYFCQPRCQPTVSLGDSTAFLKDASGQITSRNTLASPATH